MRTVTLCGSSRFETEMKLCLKLLSLSGLVVEGMSSYPSDRGGEVEVDKPSYKELLDLIYLEKISRSDAVLVIDVAYDETTRTFDGTGYVGFSAAREILWASTHNIPTALLSDFVDGDAITAEQAMRNLADALIDGEIPTVHVDHALVLLNIAIGRQQVEAQQVDTVRDVMHAVLSHIASGRTTGHLPAMVAAHTLNFLNLVVLPADQRTPYLVMVDPASSLPTEPATTA